MTQPATLTHLRNRKKAIYLTSCTNRKRAKHAANLSAESLPQGSLGEVATDWCERIKSAISTMSALELYCGRAFSEARIAWGIVGTKPYVISAGLGLLPAENLVPSYNLTTTPRSENSIAARITEDNFKPSQWWNALTERLGQANPIATLVRKTDDALFIIAASMPYAALIESDLSSLSEAELERVRIIGIRRMGTLNSKLRDCVMPYDDRFDGVGSPIPGTRGDFPQRAGRHFVETVIAKAPLGSRKEHCEEVRQALAGLPRPKTVARATRTDSEIIELIEAHWDRASGRSGRMLRILRDDLLIACEQSRFKHLFHQAAGAMAA